MIKVVTADEMKKADLKAIKDIGIPGIVLMENAAVQMFYNMINNIKDIKYKRILVICGKGNNGGDGYALARHLLQYGVYVSVLILADKDQLNGDALVNYSILDKILNRIQFVNSTEDWNRVIKNKTDFDIIVDAIFGTGLSRNIDSFYKEAIEWINCSGKIVYSVDIPSGIQGSTGKMMGSAIKANETVTFSNPKVGHYIYPGRDYTGKLSICDIGIPEFINNDIKREVISDDDIRKFIYKRKMDTNKGTYGKCCIIAGSRGMVGAGCMCALAAIRTGTGIVKLGVPESLLSVYEQRLTEIITCPISDRDGKICLNGMNSIDDMMSDCSSAAIGPGIGKNNDILEILRNIIGKYDISIVIDADGINNLCKNKDIMKSAKSKIILTPHPGEMSRLTNLSIDKVVSDPVKVATDFASEYGVTVLLKGSTSVIADQDGSVTFNVNGNPGMASAGSGDVLTGIIAGLLAQGLKPYDAARIGCCLHGKSGDYASSDKGEYGMIAGDIIENIPYAIKDILNKKQS